MDIGQFISTYPPKPPQKPASNNDELRHLTAGDGVRVLSSPPSVIAARTVPKVTGDLGCHLWVIVPSEIPYVAQKAPISPSLQSGEVKHTNLTGGEPACCGGEVWSDPADGNLLYVNGCSGRYGPESPEQMTAAEDVFRSFGYRVVSFGWDSDAYMPAKVLRT